ncbi:hypothetical protein THRCLA_23142 [Thraustotheca clavata]|uniref:Uncharacterized protein n=1 Tax=Thraustotheca clavata TaxID=74557 RepID=A0A1V9YD50_9STRA|nr:hypothetical protein THRCLA_23142 [Thraustotheca clavata]
MKCVIMHMQLGPSAEVSSIGGHIQNRMKDAMSGLNLTTQVAEMVVIECSGDFRDWLGGVTLTRTYDFDVVTLLRVQNCFGASKSNCTTILITDYRYEGTLLTTNIVYWYRFVRNLRLFGQIYNIFRVVLLVGGCYYAHVNTIAFQYATIYCQLKCVVSTILRIPPQHMLLTVRQSIYLSFVHSAHSMVQFT